MADEIASLKLDVEARVNRAIADLKQLKTEFNGTGDSAKVMDRGVNNAIRNLNKVKAEFNGTSTAAKDTSKSVKATGDAAEESGNKFGQFQQTLDHATNNLFKLKEAAEQVYSFMREGAVKLELADSFKTQIEETGQSYDKFIARLRAASGGTITDFDLMASASKSMSLGVTSDMEQMGDLLEVARFKARKFGMDTSQAFADIVTGVGRGSPLILDNLGITVNLEDAYKSYAEAIGTTVAALDDYEKKQALLNAVLQEGQAEIEAAGGLSDSRADQFRQMEVAIDSIKTKWQEFASLVGSDLFSNSNPLGGIFDPEAAATAAEQIYTIAKSNVAAITEIYGILPDRIGETFSRLGTGDTDVLGENFALLESVVRMSTLAITGDVEGMFAAMEKGDPEVLEAYEVAFYDLEKAAGDVPKGTDAAAGGMYAAGDAALINAQKVWAFKDALDAVAARQAGIGGRKEPAWVTKERLEQGQIRQQGGDPFQGTSDFAFDQQQRMFDRWEREAEEAADAIAQANRDASRAASKAASEAERAARKAAAEAKRAAEEMQQAWENAVGEVRSAVESAIDLSTDVGPNDFILRAMGLQSEAVNENGRRLQDVINRGLESPWVSAFAELRGKTDDEVRATAAHIQDQINRFLRPDLLNRDAIKQRAIENLIGKRNKEALVEEITNELVAEGYAVAEAKAAIAEQLGLTSDNNGVAMGTSMVDSLLATTREKVTQSKDMLVQLGEATAEPFIQGIINRIGQFNLVEIVAQRVFYYLGNAAQTAPAGS